MIANIIPFKTPMTNSFVTICFILPEDNSLVAKALIVIARVCIPAFPPIEATIGIKNAKATICSIVAPNLLITHVAKKAVNKFNIDKENSFIIGDKTVDIQTGKNAGLNTILVRTGYGGSDNIYNCTAGQIFKDLYESVDFIINSYE